MEFPGAHNASKYEIHDNEWDSRVVMLGTYRNPWQIISQDLNTFSHHVRHLVWGDWWGEDPFCSLFPCLFQISRNREVNCVSSFLILTIQSPINLLSSGPWLVQKSIRFLLLLYYFMMLLFQLGIKILDVFPRIFIFWSIYTWGSRVQVGS